MFSKIFLQTVCIAAGGAAGALLRYFLSAFINRLIPSTLPLGTLGANALGCFLIGAYTSAALRFGLADNLRLFFVTGFLGALTTFSTFSHESLQLLNASAAAFAANVALNLCLCFALTFSGYLLFK